MQNKRIHRLRQVIFGGVCGLINGFFGSGGGIVAVELMQKEGVEHKHAHASSLLVILPLCAVSGFVYFFTGSSTFDENTLWLLAGAGAGGAVGALMLGRLKNAVIDGAFTLIILISGVRLAFF